MKRNFGFAPYIGIEAYGFISYKSEDYLFVRQFARPLHDKGINLWYDYGVSKGKWEDTISEKIVYSSFMVLFITNSVFNSSYIKTEFNTAQSWNIPIVAVFLEDIDKSRIESKNATFFTSVKELEHKIDAKGKTIQNIIEELYLIISNNFSEKINEKQLRLKKLNLYRTATKPLKKSAKNSFRTIAIIIAILFSVLTVSLLTSNYFYRDIEQKIDLKKKPSETKSTVRISYLDKIYSMHNIEIGDYLIFGKYDQNGVVSDDEEDIVWRVLKKENNRVLVITNSVIDYGCYDSIESNLSWESCDLRKWLNNDFFDNSFDDEEKQMISDISINDISDDYHSVQDRVFILSSEEVQILFDSNDDKKAYGTLKMFLTKEEYDVSWWLRTSFKSNNMICVITPSGDISFNSCLPTSNEVGIRPSLWLEFQA